MIDRHPEDRPRLIKNEDEFIDYIGGEINWYKYYRESGQNRDFYNRYKQWIEHPQEYPCMVFTIVEDVNFSPGKDITIYFFYLEDAEDLVISSVLSKAGIE